MLQGQGVRIAKRTVKVALIYMVIPKSGADFPVNELCDDAAEMLIDNSDHTLYFSD